MINKNNNQSAFTIVELLVVIVVIGILAVIVIVSYTGIQSKAKIASLQSDLTGASQQLKLYQVTDVNGRYPDSLDGNNCFVPAGSESICLKASSGNSYTYSANNISNPKTFTLDATNGTIIYRVTNDSAPAQYVATFACGSSTVTFNYNGSSVTYGTVTSSGKCWLDRNLGATQVAVSSTDSAAYGDLFQWGRLDDGHQIRTSGTTATLSSSDTPGHGNYITAQNIPSDWRSPQKDNLWQGVSGTNNPCPSGYRLPTEAELEAERLSWGSSNSAGAFGSPLKLPLAGYRGVNVGSLYSVGGYGGYWSSVVVGTNSRYLYILGGSAGMYGDSRALGFSVRCIKN